MRIPNDYEFVPKFKYIPIKHTSDQDRRVTRADLSEDQEGALQDVLYRVRGDISENYENTTADFNWDRRISIVSLGGLAGTGKSTLVPIISEELKDTTSTAFCALTGKAANVLQRKLTASGLGDLLNSPAYIGTIHRLIYRPQTDKHGRITGWTQRDTPLTTDSGVRIRRIIVDEASMLGKNLLRDLLEYEVPILAVGDHGQLPPVQDQSVIERPDVRLEKIHRQAAGNPIIQLASLIRKHGDIPRNFPQSDQIRFVRQNESFGVVGETYERLGLNMSVLVRRNAVRKSFNCLPREIPYPVEGDIVICLKNNPPVYNGMRGIVKSIKKHGEHWYNATVLFPDDGLVVSGLLNRYQFGRNTTISSAYDLQKEDIYYPTGVPLGLLFDFGLALTVHKSQGSAFDEVILCTEKWSRDTQEEYARWLYTAVTRAVNKITIVR